MAFNSWINFVFTFPTCLSLSWADVKSHCVWLSPHFSQRPSPCFRSQSSVQYLSLGLRIHWDFHQGGFLLCHISRGHDIYVTVSLTLSSASPLTILNPSLFFETMSLSQAHPKLPGAEYYLDEYVLSSINNWPVHETVQSHTVLVVCSVL